MPTRQQASSACDRQATVFRTSVNSIEPQSYTLRARTTRRTPKEERSTTKNEEEEPWMNFAVPFICFHSLLTSTSNSLYPPPAVQVDSPDPSRVQAVRCIYVMCDRSYFTNGDARATPALVYPTTKLLPRLPQYVLWKTTFRQNHGYKITMVKTYSKV